MFRAHAAKRLPTGGEQLIRVRRTGFGVLFLPAKKLAVESKRLLPVGGDQLMPAHAPQFARLGGLLLAGFQPLDQPKRYPLRVSDNRNAADIAVRRRDVNGSAKTLDPVGGNVRVLDADI